MEFLKQYYNNHKKKNPEFEVFLSNLDEAGKIKYDNKITKQYYHEIKGEIAVISPNLDFLQFFINTYGGVLSITPFYLSQNYHKDILTSDEVTISGRLLNYSISGNFFSPIDFEKCNWCGDCYKVCPEQAIDLELNINFEKCTFCEKCDKACNENAINIKQKELIETEVQFVITDSNEIKEKFSNIGIDIYHINQLNEIFEKIGSFEITETVIHDSEICQYSDRLGIGCKRCIEACQHDAVYTDENGIEINHTLCVGCGACVSVCPTGAMQNAELTDKVFINYIKTLNLNDDSVLFISSEENIRKWAWQEERIDFLYPIPLNPSFFNIWNYLFLFSQKIKKIYIYDMQNTRKEIKFVNSLLKFFFDVENFIEEKLPSHTDIQTIKNNPLNEKYSNFSFSTRRKKLASILEFLTKSSSKKNIILQDNILDIFGTVLVDTNKCTLCLACVNSCKIGALVAKKSDYSLNHTPAICIQCKICEQVCPENAIEIAPGLLIADEFFQLKTLAKDEPLTCPGCGKIFGNKKSFEAIKEKLTIAGLFETKGKYLNYCETCRVKMLFGEKNE